MSPRHLFCLLLLSALGAPALAQAADGVAPYGYTLFEVFGVPFTNAFLTSIVLAAGLVVVLRTVVGRPQLVPSRGQAVVETIIDAIRGQMEPIVGKSMVKPAFPIIASLFFFILVHNWSGLFPGVGAFGRLVDGHLEYWFRPANTDLSNTIALALAAHAVWLFLILKHAGWRSILDHIFGNKADKEGNSPTIYLFLGVIFIVVGLIEMISIGIRPITLSMRLFGNIFGGENMLESIFAMTGPGTYWLAAIPFYFLELLVGLVQATVFALLTCVYIGLLCNHDDDHGHAPSHGHAAADGHGDGHAESEGHHHDSPGDVGHSSGHASGGGDSGGGDGGGGD